MDELLRLLDGGRRTGPAALKRDAAGRLVNTSVAGFRGRGASRTSPRTWPTGERQAPAAALRGDRARRRAGGLHRRDHPVDAPLAAAPLRRPLPLHRHVRRGEPLGAGAASGAAWRRSWCSPTPGRPSQEGDGTRATGQVVDEVRQMSDAVDVVIAGHSHSLTQPARARTGRAGAQAGGGVALLRHGLRPGGPDGRPRAAATWCRSRRRSIPRTALRAAAGPRGRGAAGAATRSGSRRWPTASWDAPPARCRAADGLGALAAEAQRRLADSRRRPRRRGQLPRRDSTPGRSPTRSCSRPRPTTTRC